MFPLIYLMAGLLVLIFLTLKKVNPFLALLLASVITGLLGGLNAVDCLNAIEKGVGQTLGSTLLILTLGGAYGSILEKSGAVQQLTHGLLQYWGISKIQWAIMAISFLIGLPLFYNAAFILLFPLVSGLIISTGLPVRYLALPMVASLSITHALTPPHPAPTALAGMLNASIPQTLLWGLCIAFPTAVIGGPLLSRFYKWESKAQNVLEPATKPDGPGSGLSLFMALLPIILITGGNAVDAIGHESLRYAFELISMPVMALLVSLLFAAWNLGLKRGSTMQEVMQWMVKGMDSIFPILLIVAAGGAFKEILMAVGVADKLAGMAAMWQIHPLLFAWILAASIRVAIGSATVAALTAAGLVAPSMVNGAVSPELMVLAIGSGSIFFSHLNDAGFWMFKEFFQLSVKETFLSWTLMESCISLIGLAGVWIIYMFVG